MKNRKPLGLDEIMIINPSNRGGLQMMYNPFGGYFAHQPEEETGQMPYDNMGYYGQYPEPEMGYFAQYPEEEVNYYGQYPEPEMGYFAQYPEEGVGYYGQSPEDEIGNYAQNPEDDMAYFGQVPDDEVDEEEEVGYYGDDNEDDEEMGSYGDDIEDDEEDEEDDVGYYGHNPEERVGGYVRDVPPPSSPRGVFSNQLGRYVRETTVNPKVDFTEPSGIGSPSRFPSFFKPHF